MRVIGPNGAGKSTLLRVLAGRTRPTRGNVRVLGMDPFRSADAAGRGRVGYLGANPGLYDALTLEENLRFCARLHGEDPGRPARVIAELSLGDIAARTVGTLSLGYRRRCGLARLLVSNHELWLLDEPWNGLDSDAGAQLAEVLRAHRGAGGTALVAAHSAGDQDDVFDSILALRDGGLAA